MDVSELIGLAGDLPDGLRENAIELLERMGSSVEGIGDSDIEWRPPILKVFQATSDRSSAPKGTTVGDLLLGDEKLEQPFRVIPIRTWDSRNRWDPDKDSKRILCRSPDAITGSYGQACKTCQFSQFDQETNRVDCTKNKTFLVMSADLRHIFEVNFSKTNYANGMEWTTLLKKAGVAPYRRQYELHTETSKKYKNVEALLVEPVALPGGNVAPEVLPFLEALFARVSSDRKDHLAAFKEQALARASNALTHDGGGEDSTAGYIEAPKEEASSEQSEQAGKYSL